MLQGNYKLKRRLDAGNCVWEIPVFRILHTVMNPKESFDVENDFKDLLLFQRTEFLAKKLTYPASLPQLHKRDFVRLNYCRPF